MKAKPIRCDLGSKLPSKIALVVLDESRAVRDEDAQWGGMTG